MVLRLRYKAAFVGGDAGFNVFSVRFCTILSENALCLSDFTIIWRMLTCILTLKPSVSGEDVKK